MNNTSKRNIGLLIASLFSISFLLPGLPLAHADIYGYSMKWGIMGCDLDAIGNRFCGLSIAGMTYDSIHDDILVTDSLNDNLQIFDANNGALKFMWNHNNSPDLKSPGGIAMDQADDTFYVTSDGDNNVKKFSRSSFLNPVVPQYLSSFGSACDMETIAEPSTTCNTNAPGAVEKGDGQFDTPSGVAVNQYGDVYVVDWGNHRVQKFDKNGTFLLKWGTSGVAPGQFKNPQGIAISSNNHVFVADAGNNRIQKFDLNGHPVSAWGTFGTGDSQFDRPVSVSIHNNNLFVADSNNHRIQAFDTNGVFKSQWGALGTGDGQFAGRYLGTAPLVSGPASVLAIFPQNANLPERVYVGDGGNFRIQVFNPPSNPHEIIPMTGNGNPTVPGSASCGCQESGPFTDPILEKVKKLTTSPNSRSYVTITPGNPPTLTLTKKTGPMTSVDLIGQQPFQDYGYSPDGRFFTITLLDPNGANYFSVYDTDDNKPAPINGLNSLVPPFAFGFSPKGHLILTASPLQNIPTQFNVQITNMTNGQVTLNKAFTITPPTGGLHNLNTKAWGFSQTGNYFVIDTTNSLGYDVTVFAMSLGHPLQVYDDQSLPASHSFQFSPCGGLFMYVKDTTVEFHFTLNGHRYPDPVVPISLDADPNTTTSADAQPANGKIILTGMTPSSIPLPKCSVTATVHSPVNIVMIAPNGLRTGFDPSTKSAINQIPDSSYTGVGSEPQAITAPYINGSYQIEAYGIDSLQSVQGYTLDVEATSFQNVLFLSGNITTEAAAGTYESIGFDLPEAVISGVGIANANVNYFVVQNGTVYTYTVDLANTARPSNAITEFLFGGQFGVPDSFFGLDNVSIVSQPAGWNCDMGTYFIDCEVPVTTGSFPVPGSIASNQNMQLIFTSTSSPPPTMIYGTNYASNTSTITLGGASNGVATLSPAIPEFGPISILVLSIAIFCLVVIYGQARQGFIPKC